ncbi:MULTISPECIES: 3-oxoacyl-ACP reductase FabG [unclassified Campylobacter]|uniref:3-oxoacyl-ACP reductase FabG n=1 Tax=unclassified Campylobacter TaxID=2593542 RepID=UPI0022EA065A|nr:MULTISPECIES: 3-oxoacyl-ACP reductase FabG [unclassified Campylobacter]MDA3055923.1 3-oxoacyl-ACP reductase FabG [Campylobacter sp. CN_NA1]MDA3066119.1 3-oxoacyl-ACP reductase FabG [Campylobacter sp. CN_NE4]MDA3069408.1 3-oxoacyl-ACP reductase FabG [Campylobacter sp. CN_NE3]MDA3082522.1 3-oxoacyl-ACP reductase FabG [Campylobacter sp. CN_EL2]MDA3083740.1 3-oxoacyl-ACP reductase FabG [Campylobacter sp. CN_NE1]
MNRRVLITGSSAGIGKACALRLAKAGYEVVLHGRNLINLQAVADEICKFSGKKPEILNFDVADTEGAKEILTKDLQNGVYYGVILNAGITRDNTFAGLEEIEWKSVIDTNLNSFYNVLNPVLMPMIRAKSPARIIVMSSVSAIMGNRGQSNYAASKAGLIAAAKSLAIELASRKITVNCIAPGLIDTAMTDLGELKDEIIKQIPARRIGEADEVAALAEFLLSENASYITRQVIGVNGGLC